MEIQGDQRERIVAELEKLGCCRPNVIHFEVDKDGDVRAWAERD